jgi:hypothetical protein
LQNTVLYVFFSKHAQIKTVKASQVVYRISTTLYTTQIYTAGDIKTSDMLNNVNWGSLCAIHVSNNININGKQFLK